MSYSPDSVLNLGLDQFSRVSVPASADLGGDLFANSRKVMNTYAVIKQQKSDDEQQFVIAKPTDFDTAVEIVIREREAEINADWYFFVEVHPERLSELQKFSYSLKKATNC